MIKCSVVKTSHAMVLPNFGWPSHHVWDVACCTGLRCNCGVHNYGPWGGPNTGQGPLRDAVRGSKLYIFGGGALRFFPFFHPFLHLRFFIFPSLYSSEKNAAKFSTFFGRQEIPENNNLRNLRILEFSNSGNSEKSEFPYFEKSEFPYVEKAPKARNSENADFVFWKFHIPPRDDFSITPQAKKKRKALRIVHPELAESLPRN
jgi:hypothetical protein